MLYSFPSDLHFLDPEMTGVPGAAKRQRTKRTAQVREGTGYLHLREFFCSADIGIKFPPVPHPNSPELSGSPLASCTLVLVLLASVVTIVYLAPHHPSFFLWNILYILKFISKPTESTLVHFIISCLGHCSSLLLVHSFIHSKTHIEHLVSVKHCWRLWSHSEEKHSTPFRRL